jgi:hypothetical protein
MVNPSLRFIDLTGQRFGRWTVMHQTGFASNGKALWGCECTCGTRRIVRGDNLRSGESKSCGCLNRELAAARTRRS